MWWTIAIMESFNCMVCAIQLKMYAYLSWNFSEKCTIRCVTSAFIFNLFHSWAFLCRFGFFPSFSLIPSFHFSLSLFLQFLWHLFFNGIAIWIEHGTNIFLPLFRMKIDERKTDANQTEQTTKRKPIREKSWIFL